MAVQNAGSATTPIPLSRPGWPEIIVGLAVTVGLLFATLLILPVAPDEPGLRGLVLMAWSVVVPSAGFVAAFLVRIRVWHAFGLRSTTWRWILVGAALGLATLAIKGLFNVAITSLTGFDEVAQGSYADAAADGLLPLILTFAMLSLLVPLGEELLFRGVLARGLLRYGTWPAVLGSSVVFAAFHGINMAMPSAFIVGLVCAEVVRRSGSIWPAVAVHIVNNAALPVLVVLSGTAAVI